MENDYATKVLQMLDHIVSCTSCGGRNYAKSIIHSTVITQWLTAEDVINEMAMIINYVHNNYES